MKTKYRIYTVTHVELNGWSFNPARPEGIKFRRNGFSFHLRAKDEDGFGLYAPLSLVIKKSILVDKSIYENILKILNGETSHKIKDMPKILQDCANEIVHTIKENTERYFDLLAWRQNLPMHDFGRYTVYWGSRKNKMWMQQRADQGIKSFSSRDRWEDWENKFQQMNRRLSARSLGHELLCEAGSLVFSAPRSATLIGFSALEVGIKEHCKKMYSETRWLLENTQSPPLAKLLKSFIPEIHKNLGWDTTDWKIGFKNYIRLTQEWTEVRNKLAHGGSFEKTEEELKYFLNTVSEILYLLDFLSGVEWANEYFRPSMCPIVDKKFPKIDQKIGFISLIE